MAYPSSDVRAYYMAALAGLRYVEARRPTGRRFGAEADAKWSTFRGDLTAADRMDLLLRDADAEWPCAFGTGWPGLAPVEAEEVWRKGARLSAHADLDELLLDWSRAWETPLASFETGPITTSALVVAGPSAIAAVIRAFVGRSDLSLSEQVTFVASGAGHRQLAALSTAIVGSAKAPKIVSAGPVTGRPLVSDDAVAADAELARSAS